MQVQKINNQPSFGIKYIKPEKWNKEVFETLQKSNLAKEIDARYPNTSAHYFFFKHNDPVNDEDIWTTLFDITINPKKIWQYQLDSHVEHVPDIYLKQKINEFSLADLESEIAKQQKEGIVPYKPKISILPKTNPIKEFFNKLFGKKN